MASYILIDRSIGPPRAGLAEILAAGEMPDPAELAALASRYDLNLDTASISRLARANGPHAGPGMQQTRG